MRVILSLELIVHSFNFTQLRMQIVCLFIESVSKSKPEDYRSEAVYQTFTCDKLKNLNSKRRPFTIVFYFYHFLLFICMT